MPAETYPGAHGGLKIHSPTWRVHARARSNAFGWCAFGLVAGALYGLWAGRGVSARRLKGVGPLLPPDSSMILAWAGQAATQDAIERWMAPASERLVMRYDSIGAGVLLEV